MSRYDSEYHAEQAIYWYKQAQEILQKISNKEMPAIKGATIVEQYMAFAASHERDAKLADIIGFTTDK